MLNQNWQIIKSIFNESTNGKINIWLKLQMIKLIFDKKCYPIWINVN